MLCASAMQSQPALSLTSAPLNFLVVGDWGRNGKEYQIHVAAQMAHEARRTDARFIVTTGDNFYNLGVSSVTDSQWTTSFDNIYKNHWLQRTWYPVLGNHDYGGNVYAQIDRTERCTRWCMPRRWHKVSGSLHGWSDIDLFFIDTVVWRGRESFPYNLLGSAIKREDQIAQKEWLTEQLLGSEARLKLVFGHHPIHSVGKHGGKMEMDDLDRLLRRAGVTAYVNGHDHCLYHIQSTKMDYICSGGGSQELKAFKGDKKTFGCVLPSDCPDGTLAAGQPQWQSFVDRAGFASFSVSDRGITFKLIDRSGVIFQEETLQIRSPDLSVVL